MPIGDRYIGEGDSVLPMYPMQAKVKPKKGATTSSISQHQPHSSKAHKLSKLVTESRGEEEGEGASMQSLNGKVDVPDPNDPSGFVRGRVAEEIVGATELEGQILFLIKW